MTVLTHPIIPYSYSDCSRKGLLGGAADKGDLYRGIFEALPAAAIVINSLGVIEMMNPKAELLLGDSLLGLLWRDVISLCFEPSTRQDLLLLKSGRSISLTTRPLEAMGGQILLMQDVTEVEELREKLQRQHRLADMGMMASTLAHQIRTPLATALLYLGQMGMSGVSEQKRDSILVKATRALRGLEQLIQQMLLYAKGERGEIASFMLFPWLDQLVMELSSREGFAAIRWNVVNHLSSKPELQSNPTLLKSALQNLLVNAIQAQGGEGEVSLIVKEDGSGSLILLIQDCGRGIDSEDQKYLFTPFQSGKRGGNGIGLSISKAVIETLGGELKLFQSESTGSIFKVTLPYRLLAHFQGREVSAHV